MEELMDYIYQRHYQLAMNKLQRNKEDSLLPDIPQAEQIENIKVSESTMPLILVSKREASNEAYSTHPAKPFKGLGPQTSRLNAKQLRILNARCVKDQIHQVNQRWANKQQVKWIQSNLVSPNSRCDPKNMEEMFVQHARSNYESHNNSYRNKIKAKLDRSFKQFRGETVSNIKIKTNNGVLVKKDNNSNSYQLVKS